MERLGNRAKNNYYKNRAVAKAAAETLEEMRSISRKA